MSWILTPTICTHYTVYAGLVITDVILCIKMFVLIRLFIYAYFIT